ncbi:hypothetical protein EC9_29780 [Rosistilla ulvae]|uniref:DUF4230 domain-containing protein n=1 Tax=Rosistilla ulvae TaxID=1930277 RepID=A0A517M1M6_9BACT|nr:DUF4230 domain-containing protein [Rosistilla ulvae]QDS88783.1 hypothetical protein EC9_29780 [Rosistilla ulvae]
MKLFALPFIFAGLIASAGGIATYIELNWNSSDSKVVVDSTPTIERITEIGDLCVLKIHTSDMLTAKSNSLKASWMITGDALISLDLTKVRLDQADQVAKALVLEMPALKVLSPRVNHEKTKHWETESVCWHDGWFTRDKLGKNSHLHEMAMKEAQKVVAQVSQSPEYMADARESAERIVTALYAGTGYTVSFQWPDERTNAESAATDTLLTSLNREHR